MRWRGEGRGGEEPGDGGGREEDAGACFSTGASDWKTESGWGLGGK